MQVSTTAGNSTGYPAVVVASQPAIFMKAEPGAFAAAVNQDGTLNSATNPAPPGSIVSIWATGLGRTFAGLQDGQIATAALDYGTGGVLVNGESAEVVYSGNAPGLVLGVVQINFRIPEHRPSILGYATISLTPSSPSAIIYVALDLSRVKLAGL